MSADNVCLVVRDGQRYVAYDCSFSDVTVQQWWNYKDHTGTILRRGAASREALKYCKKHGWFLSGVTADNIEVAKKKALAFYKRHSMPLEYDYEIFH